MKAETRPARLDDHRRDSIPRDVLKYIDKLEAERQRYWLGMLRANAQIIARRNEDEMIRGIGAQVVERQTIRQLANGDHERAPLRLRKALGHSR